MRRSFKEHYVQNIAVLYHENAILLNKVSFNFLKFMLFLFFKWNRPITPGTPSIYIILISRRTKYIAERYDRAYCKMKRYETRKEQLTYSVTLNCLITLLWNLCRNWLHNYNYYTTSYSVVKFYLTVFKSFPDQSCYTLHCYKNGVHLQLN